MKDENYFLVTLRFQDGEQRYYKERLVKAKGREEAISKTNLYLSDYWGNNTEVKTDFLVDVGSKTFTAPKGYPSVKISGIEEVEKLEDLDVIE